MVRQAAVPSTNDVPISSAPFGHGDPGPMDVMALAAHAAATVAAVMPLDGMCAALSRGHYGCASLPHTRLHC